MLELLSEKKRKILLQYPFIRDFFSKRRFLKFFKKRNKKEFLEKLEIFKPELLSKGITESDIEILKHELTDEEFKDIIKSLPRREREKAEQLRSGNPRERWFAISSLWYLRSKRSIPLIEQMLKDPAAMVRRASAEFLMEFSPNPIFHRLYSDMIVDQATELFDSGPKSLGMVKRREFRKSGSETILLGGNLADKVIVRIVSEEAFLAWRKAFEAVDAWKKAGFDYIPVEPIITKNQKLLAYRFTRKGNVFYRVYTKVILGWALGTHKPTSSKDYDTLILLKVIRNKIISVLKKLRIEHGHLHDNNFVVEMYESKPRLYVIDFDMAKIQ